jgi:hypothetical protein
LNKYHFDIDTKAAVVFTNQLEKLRRSSLPAAVRGTLNRTAFHVKQVTMPAASEKHFIRRKPNFFRANSKVFMAKGSDLNTMRAVVGFVSHNAQYNNMAVRELYDQEHGGTIEKRSFIPLKFARSGGVNTGQVKPSNRLSAIRKIIDSNKSGGRNRREQFVRAAIAAGRRGFVIGNLGKQTLFRIDSIKKVNNRTVVTKTPIYSFSKGRSVQIGRATHFMREASLISVSKMNEFYSQETKRQIQYLFR